MNEPRKASDIILSLEQKVDQLIKTQNSLDFNIKVLSNKLNGLLDAANQMPPSPPVAPYTATTTTAPSQLAMQPNTQSIPVVKEHALQIDTAPEGFRRTSRPDDALAKPQMPTINAPQMAQTIPTPQEHELPVNVNKVAVQQRVVDRNGKAVFLADVEVKDVKDGQTIHKCRTSSVGKWVAPLPVGKYQVIIRKRETTSREQLEATQNLIVDGKATPLELKMVVLQ